MADKTGGTSVGRDASAGGDLIGRDKHNVGDGALYGGNVSIQQSGQPLERYSDTELLQEMVRSQRETQIALLGDPYNKRGAPGIVAVVEDTRNAISSLVASNSQNSLRLDAADKERKLIAGNQEAMSDVQKTLIETQEKMQSSNESRFLAVDSSQENMRILVWLIAAVLIGELGYLFYFSIRFLGG